MTIWDWIHQYEMDARQARDPVRLQMTRLHALAYDHRQTNPDRMLEILEDGRRTAQRLEEPWWVAFFDHWKLETLIYYKDDYRDVVDLAVRLTLELRKPLYEQFPLRFGVWCNLVAAYLCVDPRGHEKAIREAIAYLTTAASPEGSDRYLLQARRHWFAYELGEYAEARGLALDELAMADADDDRHTAHHHEVDTYKALCWIAFRQQDWAALREYAGSGEERARSVQYRYELSLFFLWQALWARREGLEDEAKRLCRQGTAQMARLGQPPGESYYDALAAFHELAGDLEAAWEVRERELATTVGKGQLAYEAQVRLKRVRLLRGRGQPTAAEATEARAAIGKLRVPAWYEAELGRILGDP